MTTLIPTLRRIQIKNRKRDSNWNAIVAGRNIKPSDILAIRNNSNINNRYTSAGYPEPTNSIIDGCIIASAPLSTGGQQLAAPVIKMPSSNVASPPMPIATAVPVFFDIASKKYAAISAKNTAATDDGNRVIDTSKELDIQQQTSAPPTQPPTSHQSNQSSNIVSSNNSTNKQVINQSSASRKKNRRIGRHESRYTSGNNFNLLFYHFSSQLLLLFCFKWISTIIIIYNSLSFPYFSI